MPKMTAMKKTKKNPLVELGRSGVSVWSDYIRRGWILDGELRRLIEEDGLTGLTSNPTIFDKAVSGSADYDKTIEPLAASEKTVAEIFEALAVEDIRMAADILMGVYERTSGADGYVSLEVPPDLAHRGAETVEAARRLFSLVGRRNVMIKVPGTAEGLEAVEILIGEGINVNVTLLFSQERYRAVIEAYCRGLERLERSGKPLSSVASVASFFVSRMDTAVDKLLVEKIAGSKDVKEKKELKALLGKAAVANAKLAYADFIAGFKSGRFNRLRAGGARVQKLLWASTGTKNPSYSDVLYVDELIGRDIVNTLPPATIDAFRDHGRVKGTLESKVDEAKKTVDRLEQLGISMAAVTAKLEGEGVRAFVDSFESLLKSIRTKRETMRAMAGSRPGYKESLDTALAELDAARFPRRLWEKDPTLWSQDPRHQKIISNRLGWLTSPEWASARISELEAFAAEVRKAGFKKAVLLGMGGSSLAPEVYRKTFGASKGFLDLLVLDSTVPQAILNVEEAIDPMHTLFIVSSKSGGTIEVQSLFKHFHAKLAASVKDPGAHFVAVTDPGTILVNQAQQYGFRRVFLNPPDIGGRYSALSYFGLVPASLLGLDLKSLLNSARRMADRCGAHVPARENAGIELGATLAVLGREGKDKVTFITSPEVRAFGDWVEQLIAESTGKEGKELLPIVGEEPVEPGVYSGDRSFVFLALAADKPTLKRAEAFERAGLPVILIRLDDVYDVGGEYFRWEVATVVAGALLGIDAFDEPNVQESKDITAELLNAYERDRRFPDEPAVWEGAGVKVYGAETSAKDGLENLLARHFRQSKQGDYIALMVYAARTPDSEREMAVMRKTLRDACKTAATVGFGPRFLHSTGQLHKGGANNGVFLQITVDDPAELPIPGMPFSFGVLKTAQSSGDLKALKNKGRRVLRVHLTDPEKGLKRLRKAVEAAVKTTAHA